MTKIQRVLVPTLAAFALVGCGGSGIGLGNAANRSYLGTQAPGDVWNWTITDSTFSASNETTGMTYSGTSSTLVTGFLKLTIESTNDSNVTVGSSAYAVELPGTAMVVKPMGADTEPPIIACALGSNPPGPTVSFNYVKVPSAAWDMNQEAYGSVDFTVSGNDYMGTGHAFTLADLALPPTPSHFTADDGRMTEIDSGNGVQVTAAMTPSGVCILDYGPNLGGVIGVKQPTSDVNLSNLAAKSFRGFLIAGGKTQCVDVTPNGDGTLHGQGYSNPIGVETGDSDGGSGVEISFVAQPQPGLVRIDLTNRDGSESLVACVNVVGGKTMLFGFGAASHDHSGYNFLLVEK